MTRITLSTRPAGATPVKVRFTVALLLLAISLPVTAGKADGNSGAADAGPAALIRRASENELAALQSPVLERYFERLEWKWGTETRAVIETPQGRADRIVQFHDQPLAPDQLARQTRRLQKLLADRDAVRDEVAEQRQELQRRMRMMKAFPNAFIFSPAGKENGLLKFAFRPLPSFSPKDRETQVYRGMEGFVWVEPAQQRLTRIDGTLTRDVSFGWGILGRLYKGGRYVIEQTQLSPGVWRVTTLNLNLKLRIFIGSTRILRNEHDFAFERTPPDMDFRQALKMLLQSPPRPAG